MAYFDDLRKTTPDFGLSAAKPKRKPGAVATPGGIDQIAAQQLQSQGGTGDTGLDTPTDGSGLSITQEAIAANKPLLDASVANTQAQTDLIRAKIGNMTGRRYQHPLRGVGGSTPAAGQSPAMGAPITAAINPNRNLASETRGNPEFAARVAQDWQGRTAARDARLSEVRKSIMGREVAGFTPATGTQVSGSNPRVTTTPVMNAAGTGPTGETTRTITGPYVKGKGISFTPKRPNVVPRSVVQQAAPKKKNPLFVGR